MYTKDPCRFYYSLSQAGFREGLTAGKESSLQSGFAVGFAKAAECAMQWGVIRGKVMYVCQYTLTCMSQPLPFCSYLHVVEIDGDSFPQGPPELL